MKADELQIGDIVHRHTDPNIVLIELVTITHRTKGFKCTGYRVDAQHRISPWSFGFLFDQPVEISERRRV
ncbi:hypothetical protein Cs7R123_47390 [Catellatospora sp. TT07R-123]|nr:hypothetical protein Cs7R123_47390 [Catellatospora sp. TT07R-123]